MIYQGNAITVERRDTLGGNDIAILTFDLKDESVNKLSSAVMAELGNAVKAIQAESGLKGLMIRSGKDAFIVGADITEFHSLFEPARLNPAHREMPHAAAVALCRALDLGEDSPEAG